MVFSEEELTKLFRVYKTVVQMINDRNYVVSDSDLTMSKQDFKSKFGEHVKREDLVIKAPNRDKSSDQIYVFFCDDAKVSVRVVRSFFNRMTTDNVGRGIIVCQSQLTGPARNALGEISSSKHRIEIFLEDELLVNVTHHELVPEHQVLTDNEKKALLQKYTVKETQLPRILMTDPVARYFGLKRGQVVRIIRKSETAGRYVTYRFVV
ncbi:DNA-directed RNA polymerases II and IV subunit 5A-like [Cicer arietinum]|uniref:DNA-directed RNA polymerases II and IV subunit 5A-like n=1 Tax=Cicer arietinum TaxID=3827 RepID=A0A1S2Z0V9_CICAR|nr:DNA-directed RNA polymerases II and IV subunit 5A-like [Cicer arietinum]